MQEPYMTLIYDVRPAGHQSLSSLPRYNEGDFSRLMAEWKFEVLNDQGYNFVQPGQLFWALVGIEVKPGPAVLQPQVWGPDGKKLTAQNILLWNHFSSAPAIPAVDPPVFPIYEPHDEETGQPLYSPPRAVHGWTEAKGDVGWGFGSGGYINPTQPSSHNGGGYWVWATKDPDAVADGARGSDCLSKIGWWDDHIILNPIFQRQRKPSVNSPPGSGTKKIVIYDANGVSFGSAVLTDGAGPSTGRKLVVEESGIGVAWTGLDD